MMGELAKFVKNLREDQATASLLGVADDVGTMPQTIGTLVGKCEHHLDGVKSLIKRMKVRVLENSNPNKVAY